LDYVTTTRIGEAPHSVVDPHNHPSPSFNAKTQLTATKILGNVTTIRNAIIHYCDEEK